MGCWREVKSFGGRGEKGQWHVATRKRDNRSRATHPCPALLVHKTRGKKTCIWSHTKAALLHATLNKDNDLNRT